MPRKEFLGKIKFVLEDPIVNPCSYKKGFDKIYGYRRKQVDPKPKKVLNLDAYKGQKI